MREQTALEQLKGCVDKGYCDLGPVISRDLEGF